MRSGRPPKTIPEGGGGFAPHLLEWFFEPPKPTKFYDFRPTQRPCVVIGFLRGRHITWWPLQRAKKYVFVRPARPPGTPNIDRKWGPGAPQISSECLRETLDFEIGVGDRLGTLRVSRSNRLYSIQNASQGAIKRHVDHERQSYRIGS